MRPQRVAGLVALVSGSLLLLGAIVAPFAPDVFAPSGGASWSSGMGPGHMAGMPMGMGMMGPAHMGAGMMGGWRSGGGAPLADAPTVTVTAREFGFSPATLTLPSGPVNVRLVNEGSLWHDLTVAPLALSIGAAPGSAQTYGYPSLAPGTYTAICTVPGHAEAGMRLVVTVR